MKIKILKDHPMNFLEALDMLRRGNCIGINPEDSLGYAVMIMGRLRWHETNDPLELDYELLGKWYPVVEAPESVIVEITEEELTHLKELYLNRPDHPINQPMKNYRISYQITGNLINKITQAFNQEEAFNE